MIGFSHCSHASIALFNKFDNIRTISSSFILKSDRSFTFTTKTKEADRHGIGLENIKETVGKYDGSCVIKHDDDNFKVAILIHNQEK